MKRSYLIAGAVAVGVAGWLLTGVLEGDEGTPVAIPGGAGETAAPAPAVQVRAQSAESHARTIALFGRTEADRRVEIRAETSGRVAEKRVRKGQPIEAGEVLVRLEVDDREARLRRAQAWVKQREAAYRASQALRKEGFRADLRIAEDLAELEEARTMLAAAELDIERTTIRAPFAGTVERLPVEIGDYLQTGGPEGSGVVAEIVDLDPIVVVCEVTERDVPAVTLGSTAAVRLVGGTTVEGTVRFVARVATPETRTFRVEVEAPNPDGRIPEGVTAEVRLQLGEVMAHRVSPSILTLNEEGAIGVKLVGEDDVVVFSRVRIVDDTPEGMWLAGLPERVTFITVGQEFVRDGQRVRPQPETAAAAPGREPS